MQDELNEVSRQKVVNVKVDEDLLVDIADETRLKRSTVPVQVESSEKKGSPLWVESLESIWSEPAPMSWLVEKLFPEKSLIMIAGESGCGKSTLALDLAHAVATGRPFLKRQTLQRPVLIVDRENPRYVYYERIKRMNLEETDALKVWGLWSAVEPADPGAVTISNFAKARQPLIIFDSLVAFHPGSEQDSAETRKYMHKFRQLTALGATVLVIHHTGKAESSQEYRGSSDIKASVDLSFVLAAKDRRLNSLQLISKKVREGDSDTLLIGLSPWSGTFVCLEDEDRKTVEKIVQQKPNLNQSGIVAAVKGLLTEHKVWEILRKGVEGGTFSETKGLNNATLYALKAA